MTEFAPAFQDVTWTSAVTTSAGMPVSMPATVNLGDVLMACVWDFAYGYSPTKAGWTWRGRTGYTGIFIRYCSYDRVADGTEGGTVVDFPAGGFPAGYAFLAGVVRFHFSQTYSAVQRDFVDAMNMGNPFGHYALTPTENIGTNHALVATFLSGDNATGHSQSGYGTDRGAVSGSPWVFQLGLNVPTVLTLVTLDNVTGNLTGLTDPNVLFTGPGPISTVWVGWSLKDGLPFGISYTSPFPTLEMHPRKVRESQLPYEVHTKMGL